jgi:hypothetical protein
MRIKKVSKVINNLKMELKKNHFKMELNEIKALNKKINDLKIILNHTNIKYLKGA